MRNLESRIVPLLILVFAVFVAVCIPYKIIGYGYLPGDDATRHSAKVVSGKNWNDILVLRDDIKMDNHPGWHSILSAVHKATDCSTLDLAVFSVISLFIFFTVIPLFLTKRPESWLLTLLIIAVANMGIYYRLLIGRPFLFNMAYMTALLFTWERLKQRPLSPWFISAITLFAALSIWIHCGWYLFALPCMALFLAREWRAGMVLSAVSLAGVLAGVAMTGHPFMFLAQITRQFFLTFAGSAPQYVLVGELQPADGDFLLLIILALFMLLRAVRNKWERSVIDNPVFILLCLCWAMGFLVGRIWIDIGFCAAAVWLAREIDGLLEESKNTFSFKRLAAALGLMLVLYQAVSNDSGGRWSFSRPNLHVTPATVGAANISWLPDSGGVIYSNSMGIFYNMFFRNPRADWKYILGFEPAFMPAEDLKTLRDIQTGKSDAYTPWVAKMGPKDRLILFGAATTKPDIKGLEWKFIANSVWSGRLPRASEPGKSGSATAHIKDR